MEATLLLLACLMGNPSTMSTREIVACEEQVAREGIYSTDKARSNAGDSASSSFGGDGGGGGGEGYSEGDDSSGSGGN